MSNSMNVLKIILFKKLKSENFEWDLTWDFVA